MMKEEIVVINRLEILKCFRCGHSWYPRKFRKDGTPINPKLCPICKRKGYLNPSQEKGAKK